MPTSHSIGGVRITNQVSTWHSRHVDTFGVPRYVAFLRGVSPQNAKMPALKRCFEEAGFKNVKTVLSSGNVVFDERSISIPAIEKKVEAAMLKKLGRSFFQLSDL